jgi:hypothetical protein
VTALGSITLQGGSTLSGRYAMMDTPGSQSISAANITLQSGAGGYARLYAGGTQSVTSTGSIALRAGDAPAELYSMIDTLGSQTVSAANITLQGGAGGYARIVSAGTQSVTATGSVMLQAGGTLNNRYAMIESTGTASQTVSAGRLEALAGSGGTANYAGVRSLGSQQVTVGAGGLLIRGGGGTGADTDNEAFIDGAMGLAGAYQRFNMISGGGITLQGGDSAKVDVGGAGHGSFARIQAGTSTVSPSEQLINFADGGTLSLTGGSAGSRAFALIFAEGSSTQTIQGASTLSLTGGSGGGFYNSTTNSYEGNRATIANEAGAQTISAG